MQSRRNLFERDGEGYVGRELRRLDNLLDNEPPGATHSATSHHAPPRRPRGLRRLNSEEDLSEKLARHIGPPTLLHGCSSCTKTPTSIMGIYCLTVDSVFFHQNIFSSEKTDSFLVCLFDKRGSPGRQLLLVKLLKREKKYKKWTL